MGFIGSFMATIIGLFMSIAEGLINLPTLAATMGITILCAIWFFTSRDI